PRARPEGGRPLYRLGTDAAAVRGVLRITLHLHDDAVLYLDEKSAAHPAVRAQRPPPRLRPNSERAVSHGEPRGSRGSNPAARSSRPARESPRGGAAEETAPPGCGRPWPPGRSSS